MYVWIYYEQIILALLRGWEIIFLSKYIIYFSMIFVILNNFVHIPKPPAAAQDKGKLLASFFLNLNKIQNKTELLWEGGQKTNPSFLFSCLVL